MEFLFNIIIIKIYDYLLHNYLLECISSLMYRDGVLILLIRHLKVLFGHNWHDFLNYFLKFRVDSCAELIYYFSGQESVKKILADIHITVSLIQHPASQIRNFSRKTTLLSFILKMLFNIMQLCSLNWKASGTEKPKNC